MGKLEEVMKSEIARLARKELKATCVPLAKQVRELKRTVSALRNTVAGLAKGAAVRPETESAGPAVLEAPEQEVAQARFSAGLIKKLRTRLGLTQKQLATLLGVSLSAVTFWELGRSRPQGKNKVGIVALRRLGRRQVKKLLEQTAPAAAPPAPAKPKRKAKAKKKVKAKAKVKAKTKTKAKAKTKKKARRKARRPKA